MTAITCLCTIDLQNLMKVVGFIGATCNVRILEFYDFMMQRKKGKRQKNLDKVPNEQNINGCTEYL